MSATKVERFIELLSERIERGLAPLLKRVEELEKRDQRITAIDARLRQLEAAARTPVEAEPGDGLGGA